MNEIAILAARYFDRFESISLYPGPKSKEFWLALLGSLIFVSGLVWYVHQGPSSQSGVRGTAVILLADAALLWGVSRVDAFHRRAVLALANEGRGTNLQSVATAKAATLCRFLNCRASEFLRVASDIQHLRALSTPRGGRRTSWPRRIGIDDDARSRLMSILLSVLAVLVTLLATSPAIQDTFFAAIVDEGVWKLIGVLEFFALFLLSMAWGALWLTRVGTSIAMRWSIKLSGSRWANEQKVDYLVQDLARLHRMPPRRPSRGASNQTGIDSEDAQARAESTGQ